MGEVKVSFVMEVEMWLSLSFDIGKIANKSQFVELSTVGFAAGTANEVRVCH